jgi:hypothetical protein
MPGWKTYCSLRMLKVTYISRYQLYRSRMGHFSLYRHEPWLCTSINSNSYA